MQLGPDAVGRVSAAGVGVTEVLVLPAAGEPPNPAEAILTALRATEADLLVMTTHGRTGAFRAILGSVADSVIRRADVPVLLITRAAAPSADAWLTLAELG